MPVVWPCLSAALDHALTGISYETRDIEQTRDFCEISSRKN